MKRPAAGSAFPFSALVGLGDLQLALLLAAVDHRIGGVLLRGQKGSAKTTAARALASLLREGAPFVELPLGATEDRVVGSFDVRAALGTGEYRYRPGLLESADGGVLYVDEVNLLADHLVDVLLDAAATGSVRVERDGVSETRAARFVLIGSMNPEEGELRPQLLDRFGLSVVVGAPLEADVRAEAVRRRLDFDRDPAGFSATWARDDRDLAARLAAARDRPAQVSERLVHDVAGLCASAGAEGLRADLVVCRAAAALAAWEGRDEAVEADVERVAPLALAHRRKTPWEPLHQTPRPGARRPGGPAAGDGGGSSDGGGSTAAGSGGPRSSGQAPPAPASGQRATGDPAGAPGGTETRPGRPARASGPRGGAGSSRPPGRGAGPGAETAFGPGTEPPRGGEGFLERAAPVAGPEVATGAGRRRHATVEAARGRLVGSRAPGSSHLEGPLHAGATVMAAAARGAVGPGAPGGRAAPLDVRTEDLREQVHRVVRSNLVVLVVDASGSMGVKERLEAARAAVHALLVDAYQRRDRVALVTFRGSGAEVLLRPTGSTEVARARLAELPTGGRTPLAAGIREGLALALARRHASDRALLVVVSDGRATWGEQGEDPVDAALDAARAVRAAGVDALVVDCEPFDRRLGLASALAGAMGARWLPVADLTGEALVDAVRAQLA